MIWFLVWLIVVVLVAGEVWRRRDRLVPKRGLSVRADVERLHDMPRVIVAEFSAIGADSARLTLVSAGAGRLEAAREAPVMGEFLIAISDREAGYAILRDWRDHKSVLGVVMPPDTRIMRLRSLDDLQPLTLRLLDD